MDFSQLDQIQLEWMLKMQGLLRSSMMDAFFKTWNLVDTPGFYLLLGAVVWRLWNRRIGIQLFYTLLIGTALIILLKQLFAQPRPCHIDTSVGILCHSSYGFPSGAASSAAIVFGMALLECRSRFSRSLALLFALLLCFSRVYLGLHYPTDILGGLVVGALCFLGCQKLFPLIERLPKVAILLVPSIFLLISFACGDFKIWGVFYCFSLGTGCGLMLPGDELVRIRQGLFVIGGVLVLLLLQKMIPSLLWLFYILQGYWLAWLGARVEKQLFPASDIPK